MGGKMGWLGLEVPPHKSLSKLEMCEGTSLMRKLPLWLA